MARRTERKPGNSPEIEARPKPQKAQTSPENAEPQKDDAADLADALSQVAGFLYSATERLRALAPSVGREQIGAVAGAEINSWDDPFSEAVPTTKPAIATPIVVALPVDGFARLQTQIAGPQPPPGRYAPGTAEFRYWVAAEALTRGVNYWGALLPAGTTWSTTNPMQVSLVDGEQLNAGYWRQLGLRFFRQKVQGVDIFACESPDVVCHELGHAVLDALRPQLFDAANIETSAFHESFGDMSAILCALQVKAIRETVIAETKGRLNVNSRLSRLAEQLGWGLRQISGTAEDDCLRNAANHFFYRDPSLLSPEAAASLTSEAHSFSRIFTGAFLDALARMFVLRGATNDADLLAVSHDLGQLLIDGVHGAPISPAYFNQVAAGIVQADQARFGGRYRNELLRSFVEHGVLSVSAPMELRGAPTPEPLSLAAGPARDDDAARSSIYFTYSDRRNDDGFRLGLGMTPELPRGTIAVAGLSLEAHLAEEQPRFLVTSAGAAPRSRAEDDRGAAARLFVEGLIQRSEINPGEQDALALDIAGKHPSRVTHALTIEDGKTVLRRSHFSCGCLCTRSAFASLAAS